MKVVFFYEEMPQELLDFMSKDKQGSVIKEGIHPCHGQNYPRARAVLRETENFVSDGEREKALNKLFTKLLRDNKVLRIIGQ